MSKGSSFLFEIERSSRQRVVQIERLHCTTTLIRKIKSTKIRLKRSIKMP